MATLENTMKDNIELAQQLADLANRVTEQERLIAGLNSAVCDGNAVVYSDDEPFKALSGATEILDGSGNTVKARTKTFYWRNRQLLNMKTITSWLKLYDTGLYESECDLENLVGHRKYANYVQFTLKTDEGTFLGSLGEWSGNFGHSDHKQYPTGGTSNIVRDNFDLIDSRGKVRPSRYWYVRER